MFFRATPGPAPRPVPRPAALVQDKVLPLIPFSPDWAPPSGAAEIPAQNTIRLEPTPRSDQASGLPLILAEADPLSRALICDLGRKWGYRVAGVNDGVDAFAAICATTEPALAVISWHMNGMTGIEICRATREMNLPVYIVLVTERSGAEQLDQALEAGADDYLITPFDADELRARIRVGARVIELQSQVADGRRDLEAASARERALTGASKGTEVTL